MSPISFEDLVSRHPEYKRVLLQVKSWMAQHSDAGIINPNVLAKDLSRVDSAKLAAVLTLLHDAGYLKRVYKVLTPSGVLAEGEFDDPTRIPDRLPDRFEAYFDTAEADVVPVFKKVA